MKTIPFGCVSSTNYHSQFSRANAKFLKTIEMSKFVFCFFFKFFFVSFSDKFSQWIVVFSSSLCSTRWQDAKQIIRDALCNSIVFFDSCDVSWQIDRRSIAAHTKEEMLNTGTPLLWFCYLWFPSKSSMLNWRIDGHTIVAEKHDKQSTQIGLHEPKLGEEKIGSV